jgi:hypothetical protein
VHKLKRDHPLFLPKMQALAFDQVRTIRMEAPDADYPSWYNIQMPDLLAAVGVPPIKVTVEPASVMETVAGVVGVQSQKWKALSRFKGSCALVPTSAV